MRTNKVLRNDYLIKVFILLLFFMTSFSISKVQAQASDDVCNLTPSDWGCQTASLLNPLNGVTYHIKLSWSLKNSTNIQATTLWAAGSDGKWPYDLVINSLPTANQLASQHNIRSIFLDFINPLQIPNQAGTGGYFAGLDGYKNASKAFDLAVRHIVQQGLDKGQYLTYVSGSNGTTVASYALAYHGTDLLFDQMILNAGPIVMDVQDSCFNEQSPANFDVGGAIGAGIRALVDLWNGWSLNPNEQYCQRKVTPSDPSILAQRSLLDLSAKRNFPNLTIHSIVGLQDEYGLSLLRGNRVWFENVNAKFMSLTCYNDMGHEMNYPEILDLASRGPSSVTGKVIEGNCADFPSGIANPVTRGIATVQNIGANSYVVGWACIQAYYKSIAVHAYVGGPAGQGGTLLRGALAGLPTEQAVNNACLTSGSFHRFRIPITAAEKQLHHGKPIYVYGIAAPTGVAANAVLGRSGAIFVP